MNQFQAIGQNIKQYRKGKMTQQELADKIGKTESSIRKYEKGIVTIPLNVLEQIASALDVSVSDLMILELVNIDHKIDTTQKIHETTSFKNFLDVLGYEIHESPYDDKWEITIKESGKKIYISSAEMNILESTTKENIDLRITKYLNDGEHNQ